MTPNGTFCAVAGLYHVERFPLTQPGHRPLDERIQPQISCQAFIREYSEYRDDRMSPTARAAVTAHLASCASCRRYDRVIRKGVEVLRSAPEIKPRKPLTVATVRRMARAAEQREHRRQDGGAASPTAASVAAPDF